MPLDIPDEICELQEADRFRSRGCIDGVLFVCVAGKMACYCVYRKGYQNETPRHCCMANPEQLRRMCAAVAAAI